MHSSRMAKIAGSTETDAEAIFIIPWFFAESGRHPSFVSVIWPEDGAASSPLYFLARESEHQRLAEVIRFFTEIFPTLESSWTFAPLGFTDTSQIPSEASLKWIGWDYIREHDINTLRDQLGIRFRSLLGKLK